jgi:hypothetical protein
MISAPNGLATLVIVVALFCATAALLAAQLRTEGYGLSASVALGGLAIAQPAYAMGMNTLHTALLALVTCTMAVCAVALVKEQSARRIILLGSSLAGAQLVNLPDGLAATLMLPAILRLPRSRVDVERTLGLYVLLLFLPGLVLLGRLYFVWLGQTEIARWSDEPWPVASNRTALVAIAAAIMFLPVLLETLAVEASMAISALLSLAAATLIAALISSPADSVCALAAILPPLAILLVGQWPVSLQRTRIAVLTVAAATGLAWAYELAAQVFAHA